MLNSIAESKRSAGRLDEAERCYREALDLARADGGRLTIVVVLNNLIRVLVARGRPAPARGLAAEFLALVRHDQVGVDLLEASVGLASFLGDHAAAARFWGAADQKLKEWGYRHQPVDIEHSAPLIARSRGALGEAAFAAAETAGRALDFETAMLELQRWLEPPA
jgi:tetratricopeptide (TPR) repeat protein